mmetsp:Transcript_17492/g.45509  ORF Transcript_17492/g.45509 Transcript_17492/m.45509 type:complete len:203 (+) Transcript_17492:308-916(+)
MGEGRERGSTTTRSHLLPRLVGGLQLDLDRGHQPLGFPNVLGNRHSLRLRSRNLGRLVFSVLRDFVVDLGFSVGLRRLHGRALFLLPNLVACKRHLQPPQRVEAAAARQRRARGCAPRFVFAKQIDGCENEVEQPSSELLRDREPEHASAVVVHEVGLQPRQGLCPLIKLQRRLIACRPLLQEEQSGRCPQRHAAPGLVGDR